MAGMIIDGKSGVPIKKLPARMVDSDIPYLGTGGHGAPKPAPAPPAPIQTQDDAQSQYERNNPDLYRPSPSPAPRNSGDWMYGPGGPYDRSTFDPTDYSFHPERAGGGGGGSGGGRGGGGLTGAYRGFLPSTTLAPAPSRVSVDQPATEPGNAFNVGGGATEPGNAFNVGGGATEPGNAFNVGGDRKRQDMERTAMRDLLMNRIGAASKPVDANDPGIKGILASQRLSRQRSEERQRSQAAVKASSEGLLDSGAFDTELSGIQQARGAGESADITETMGQEHQAKRQELLQLYQQAIQMGDTEAARTLQQQLATQQLGEGARQFDLGRGDRTRQQEEENRFRRSSFLDNLRLQMSQLEAR